MAEAVAQSLAATRCDPHPTETHGLEEQMDGALVRADDLFRLYPARPRHATPQAALVAMIGGCLPLLRALSFYSG